MDRQQVFDADLERLNTALHDCDAVVTTEDGARRVNPAKAPAGLLRAYRNLLIYGAANGLLPHP